MQIESTAPSPLSPTEMIDAGYKSSTDRAKISADDLYLLCDLFYLPFEHGSRGFKLLNEFNWLKANAHVLLEAKNKKNHSNETLCKPEVSEWLQRAECFSSLCNSVQDLLRKIATCENKEICHDLFSYIWDIAGALSLLNAFVKWLRLGFSKGWKEAFMSGDQEPWVFRGGLIADLQRLMPVDSGNDLFLYKLPELPTTEYHVMRPYTHLDENCVNDVCTQQLLSLAATEGNPEDLRLPENLKDLIADYLVGSFITLQSEFCIVATDASGKIVGYTASALNSSTFLRDASMCWIPEMCKKYSKSLLEKSCDFTESKALNNILSVMINDFHQYNIDCPTEVSNSYPAAMTAALLDDALGQDYGIAKRLVTVMLATLRANGCFGVHVRLPAKDIGIQLAQHYIKLGFAELNFHKSLQKNLVFGYTPSFNAAKREYHTSHGFNSTPWEHLIPCWAVAITIRPSPEPISSKRTRFSLRAVAGTYGKQMRRNAGATNAKHTMEIPRPIPPVAAIKTFAPLDMDFLVSVCVTIYLHFTYRRCRS
uniref:Uncharacterized protein n=1 Tax=Glossina palpalis gambiensis TaxID=67801 RepID=A0A1B0C007_9MUSC